MPHRSVESRSGARDDAVALYELALALGRERELAARLDLVMGAALDLLGVDHSQVALIAPGGADVEVVGARGTEAATAIVRQPIDTGLIGECIRTNRPLRSSDVLADPRTWDQVLARREGARAWIGCPLTDGDGAFGVLCAHRNRPLPFSDEDERRLVLLAELAGASVREARLHQAEGKARAAAERAVERTIRLQAVTAALSVALTPEQVVEVILEQGSAALGTESGVVGLLTDGGTTLEMPRAVGATRHLVAPYQRVPLDAPIPTADVIRSREPMWLESQAAFAEHYPHLAADRAAAGRQALAVLPLVAHDRAIGSMAFSFHEPKPFSVEEREFLLTLAHQCAQALERARLYREEHETAQLRAQERDRLQQLLDLLPAAVLTLDERGVFSLANGAAKELLGANVVGRALPEAESEAYAHFGIMRADNSPFPPGETPLQRAYRRGETVVAEPALLSRGSNGGSVPLLVNAAPLRDATGAIVGAVAVCQDISALRDLERERETFLAAISHDLKTPLTTIRGQSQLLLRWADQGGPPEPEQAIAGLRKIVAATARIAAQIDELADLARLEMGGAMHLAHRPVDLVQLARQAARAAQETTNRHRVLVRAPRGPIVGHWDESRLTRVLDNLISNAIKFSPKGGPVRIALERQSRDGRAWAVVRVSDRGLGIPEAERAKVFVRFFRASNVAGQTSGSGIGLAGARQIVEQHGGTIEVESQEGSGSTFTVLLPLHPPRRDA